MKMAPGALPRPGKVPEQRLLSPELGFWMAVELRRISGKILRVLSVLGQGVFMGEEATQGGGQGHQATSKRGQGAAPSYRLIAVGLPSGSPLDSVFVSVKNCPP